MYITHSTRILPDKNESTIQPSVRRSRREERDRHHRTQCASYRWLTGDETTIRLGRGNSATERQGGLITPLDPTHHTLNEFENDKHHITRRARPSLLEFAASGADPPLATTNHAQTRSRSARRELAVPSGPVKGTDPPELFIDHDIINTIREGWQPTRMGTSSVFWAC